MKRLFHKTNQYLSAFCGWLLIGMMLLLVADIVFRYVDRPLQGMAEYSVFVMMIVIYLGLARCEQQGEHVRLEIVLNACPAAIRRIILILAHILALLIIAILFYAVLLNAIDSFQSNESIHGTKELYIWPVKFLMVAGLFFFLAQACSNFIALIRSGEND